jgi:hypothetical protein
LKQHFKMQESGVPTQAKVHNTSHPLLHQTPVCLSRQAS